MENKILIIEDEPKVVAFIKRGLEEQKYEVEVATDGLSGKKLALFNQYSLIILDINLPLMSGFEVAKSIRNANISVPILMLTALGTTDDKIEGFDSGADDYLVKPFEFRELLARTKALVKRASTKLTNPEFIRVGDLDIFLDNKTVKRGNKKIDLTAKEFALLRYLAVNKGRVVSRNEIAEHVWDISFDTGTNVIDVYVNFLRKKIDRDFPQKLIHTYIGMGYVLREADE
jgi:two-component system copper resistance phosphate regulon response regulator CusR